MASTDKLKEQISSMNKDMANLRSEVAVLRKENKLVREKISSLKAGKEENRASRSGLVLLIICGCVLVAAMVQLWREVRDVQQLVLREKSNSESIELVREDLSRNISSIRVDLDKNISSMRVDLDKNISSMRVDLDKNIDRVREDMSRIIESVRKDLSNRMLLVLQDHSKNIALILQNHSSTVASLWEENSKNITLGIDNLSKNFTSGMNYLNGNLTSLRGKVDTNFESITVNLNSRIEFLIHFQANLHNDLEKRVQKIGASVEMQHHGGLLWRIDGWAAKKLSARGEAEEIFSEAFFSHKNGYRMCLSVFPNGFQNHKGTHLAVYFYIMRGPFDNILPWPFKLNVTLSLIDQSTGRNHVSQTIKYNDITNLGDLEKPKTEKNKRIGTNQLMELAALSGNAGLWQDDKIFIRSVVK